MKKLNLLVIVGLCGMLAPSLALAGNGGTGACLIVQPDVSVAFPEGEGCFAVCIDGVTEQECEFKKGPIEWFEGQTCGELEVPWEWEGGCQADVPPFGDQCYILACDGDAELTCEEVEGGIFFEDDLSCGLGVPTMPGFGMAAMALLLLAGALVLLTIRGSLVP